MKHQSRRRQPERGIGHTGHIVVLVAFLSIVASFAAVWNANQRQSAKQRDAVADLPAANPAQPPAEAAASDVQWLGTGRTGSDWRAVGGTPPQCPEPLMAVSPVDTARASAVLLPGQYRGTHYKAHGGFRYDGSKSQDISVTLPFDARLTGAVRYLEAGELQYLLTFVHPCGYMLRFDHLAGLTAEFMAIMDKQPAARAGDSRGRPIKDGPSFKAGTVVATAIGQPAAGNIGLDIGVYDLRQPNAISKDSAWSKLHRNESAQTFYGVCWLPLLPEPHASRARQLMAELPKNDKGASDYCDGAPGGSTLRYNAGKPVPEPS